MRSTSSLCPDSRVKDRHWIGLRGVGGPDNNAFDRRFVKANLRIVKPFCDTFLPGLFDNVHRTAMFCNRLQQWHWCDLSSQVIAANQSAESRQSLFEMMSNLTLQFRPLLDEIASMASQNL